MAARVAILNRTVQGIAAPKDGSDPAVSFHRIYSFQESRPALADEIASPVQGSETTHPHVALGRGLMGARAFARRERAPSFARSQRGSITPAAVFGLLAGYGTASVALVAGLYYAVSTGAALIALGALGGAALGVVVGSSFVSDPKEGGSTRGAVVGGIVGLLLGLAVGIPSWLLVLASIGALIIGTWGKIRPASSRD